VARLHGRAWLAVALHHKSWLYERGLPDGPNGALIVALGQLGNDVLSVELLACLQQTEPQASLARRHRVLARERAAKTVRGAGKGVGP
jgi:hypothetical protein